MYLILSARILLSNQGCWHIIAWLCCDNHTALVNLALTRVNEEKHSRERWPRIRGQSFAVSLQGNDNCHWLNGSYQNVHVAGVRPLTESKTPVSMLLALLSESYEVSNMKYDRLRFAHVQITNIAAWTVFRLKTTCSYHFIRPSVLGLCLHCLKDIS